jgi:hypothetical protein
MPDQIREALLYHLKREAHRVTKKPLARIRRRHIALALKGKLPERTVYHFLEDRDCRLSTVDAMIEALNLRVTLAEAAAVPQSERQLSGRTPEVS